jgi:hypothetical protein
LSIGVAAVVPTDDPERVGPPSPLKLWAANTLYDLGMQSRWADEVRAKWVAYTFQRRLEHMTLKTLANPTEDREAAEAAITLLDEAEAEERKGEAMRAELMKLRE